MLDYEMVLTFRLNLLVHPTNLFKVIIISTLLTPLESIRRLNHHPLPLCCILQAINLDSPLPPQIGCSWHGEIPALTKGCAGEHRKICARRAHLPLKSLYLASSFPQAPTTDLLDVGTKISCSFKRPKEETNTTTSNGSC